MSIYKSVANDKSFLCTQAYEIGEYFFTPPPHHQRFPSEKQPWDFIGYRGLLPLPLRVEEVTSQAYQAVTRLTRAGSVNLP